MLIGRPVKIFVIISVALLLSLPLWYRYSPAGRQRENIDKAQACLPKLLFAVRSDPRFDGVRCGLTTAHGGAMFFAGYVSSDGDLADLNKIIDSQRGEANIIIAVQVDAQKAQGLKSHPPTSAP